MRYSLARPRRRARGRAGLPGARRRACCPWSPLGGGVLTGKYRGGVPADSRAAVGHRPDLVRVDDRPGRRHRGGGRHCGRGAGDVAGGRGAGLAARPAGRVRADPRRAHPRPAHRGAGQRGARAPARDPRCARRRVGARAAIPRTSAELRCRPGSRSSPPSARRGCGPGSVGGWPTELADAGIHGPADVTTPRLAALPKVGPQRAGRLLSAFIAADTGVRGGELLVPAGLDARMAGRAVDLLGPPAPRLLRDDPWRLLAITGVTPADADRVARAALPGVTRDDARRARALVGWVLARQARDGHTLSPARWWPRTVAELARRVRRRSTRRWARSVVAADPTPPATRSRRTARTAARGPDAGPRPVRRGRGRDRRGHRSAARHRRADHRHAPSRPRDLDATQRAAVDAALRGGRQPSSPAGPAPARAAPWRRWSRLAEAAGQDGRPGCADRPGRETARGAVRRPPRRRCTGCSARSRASPATASASTAASRAARTGRWTRTSSSSTRRRCSTSSSPTRCSTRARTAPTCCFVGDAAQLPSIGPGRVLGDLIDSGVGAGHRADDALPPGRGRHDRAAGDRGARRRAARGRRPDPRGGRSSPPAVRPRPAHRVVQLVTDSIPRALGIPAEQVQVVTPVHRGAGRHAGAERRAQGEAQPRQRPRAASIPATGSWRRPTTSRPSRSATPTARSAPWRTVERRRHGDRRVRVRTGRGQGQGAGRPAARLGDHRPPGAGLGVPRRGRGAAARGRRACCRGRSSTPR